MQKVRKKRENRQAVTPYGRAFNKTGITGPNVADAAGTDADSRRRQDDYASVRVS
jgi:hypothetical protein